MVLSFLPSDMANPASPATMPKYEVKDLGIKEPNLLVFVKSVNKQYAFPVHKEALAYHSTVFADMLTLSQNEEDEQDHNNRGPKSLDKLETVTLEDPGEDVENAFRHLFSGCALPTQFGHEAALGVYKLADKYGMQRLCDWMRDKLL